MSEITCTATDLETAVHTVRLEATNHEGCFLGKNVAPKKFAASAGSGFAIADLLFGLDLGNAPTFGFAYPEWRGHLVRPAVPARHVDAGAVGAGPAVRDR